MALITYGLTKDDNLLDVRETKGHRSTVALDKTKFKVLCLNCKLCHKPQNIGSFFTWIQSCFDAHGIGSNWKHGIDLLLD